MAILALQITVSVVIEDMSPFCHYAKRFPINHKNNDFILHKYLLRKRASMVQWLDCWIWFGSPIFKLLLLIHKIFWVIPG